MRYCGNNALSCVGGAAALAPDALPPPELLPPQAASSRAEAVTLPATIPLRMMFPPLGTRVQAILVEPAVRAADRNDLEMIFLTRVF